MLKSKTKKIMAAAAGMLMLCSVAAAETAGSDAPEVQLISRNPGSDKGAAAMAVKLLIDSLGTCGNQLWHARDGWFRKWKSIQETGDRLAGDPLSFRHSAHAVTENG